jgi:hypothetical protein
MKREELLKVFPCLSDKEIHGLPSELVVCWYPSSGSHFEAAEHFEKEDTNLNPNFFIFSDASRFECPDKAKMLVSKKVRRDYGDLLTDYFNLPLNYEMFPDNHVMNQHIEVYEKHITTLYSLGLISNEDLIIKKNEDLESVETMEKRIQLNLLVKLNLIDFEALKKQYCDPISEFHDIVGENGEPLRIQLVNYKNKFFLLVQSSNEVMYNRFINEKVSISSLILNRPMDSFIFDHGIDLKELGINEFIAGHSYVGSLSFGEEFIKHPDFVFQTINNVHQDMANLYVLKNRT